MPRLARGGFFFDQTYQSRYFELRILARLLEPGMLVRGVVDDEIDEHADAALLGAVGELDEVAEGAVARIDAVVVGRRRSRRRDAGETWNGISQMAVTPRPCR